MKLKSNIRLSLAALYFLTACDDAPVPVAVNTVDSTELNILLQTPGHAVLSQQATVKFGDSLLSYQTTLQGYIVPDERRTNYISARFNGRIEKLYVRFPYQYVHKGDKLMDIYSSEMSTAFSEHLLLFTKDSASSLTKQSRARLSLLGITTEQIAGAERSGVIPQSISIYSPYTGYSLPVNASVSSEGQTEAQVMNEMGSGMKNTPESSGSSSLEIREGSYIAQGQVLFSINDAAVVIARLSMPESLTGVSPGDSVNVIIETNTLISMNGKVRLVEPSLSQGEKFPQLLVELINDNRLLQFNSLAGAAMETEAVNGTLPASCVYDLGQRKIVWVKTKTMNSVNVFVPRVVTTGPVSNEWVQVFSGLQYGEEVASQAGLLTDREGLIITELQ